MPVSFIVQKRSTRLAYTLDLVFTRILGLEINLCNTMEEAGQGPAIRYGESVRGDAICIPDAGLLWETDCGTSPTDVTASPGLSKVYFAEQFDLLSAVFWMVTEYENYRVPSFDHHHRYTLSPIHQQLGLETRPVIHLWVSELEEQLMAKWPELRSEQQKPIHRHQITFDLDNPWKYLYKPLWVQLGGLAKALATLRFTEIKERLKTLFTGNDPNDTLENIFQICSTESTTFFILLENLHANDSRFTWRHKRWRKRINAIDSQGYSVGIHPSYLAMEQEGQIQREKKYLEEIIGKTTSKTRMHFLRYKLPTTRREMIQAGIREDYTPYLPGTGGFPNGMMIPYPWFDLGRNQATELTLVPTILMDRTLVGTPSIPKFTDHVGPPTELLGLLDTIIEGNGAFVLCLHNECLSESGEWKGWSSWFAEIIGTLEEQNTGGRS